MPRAHSLISALGWTAGGCLVAAVGVGLWLGRAHLKSATAVAGSQVVEAPSIETTSKVSDVAINLKNLPATNEDLLAMLQSSLVDLSPLKVDTALTYLKNPQRAETAMDPAAEYFNNIISLLLRQSEFSSELSKSLLGVVNDANQALLLRDYAMQHFFHCWSREINVETRRALELSLKSHARDGKSQLQGVALLTTSRFYEQGKLVKGPDGEKLTPLGGSPAFDSLSISKPTSFTVSEFVASALQVTTDLAAAPGARASAFNVLLNMEVRQAIDPARQILQETTTPDEVRCSSLAVIGAFGNLAQDRVVLDAIPVIPEHVRRAADLALSKLLQSTQTKP